MQYTAERSRGPIPRQSLQTIDVEPTHRQYHHHAIGNKRKSISSLEPTSDNVITDYPIVRESQSAFRPTYGSMTIALMMRENPSALLEPSKNPIEYGNMAVLSGIAPDTSGSIDPPTSPQIAETRP